MSSILTEQQMTLILCSSPPRFNSLSYNHKLTNYKNSWKCCWYKETCWWHLPNHLLLIVNTNTDLTSSIKEPQTAGSVSRTEPLDETSRRAGHQTDFMDRTRQIWMQRWRRQKLLIGTWCPKRWTADRTEPDGTISDFSCMYSYCCSAATFIMCAHGRDHTVGSLRHTSIRLHRIFAFCAGLRFFSWAVSQK